MLRLAGLDEWTRSGRATRIKRNRDDREIEILEFFVQSLPPGQVKGASSPRGPCEQENFPAAIIRQAMQLTVEIGQFEIGSL